MFSIFKGHGAGSILRALPGFKKRERGTGPVRELEDTSCLFTRHLRGHRESGRTGKGGRLNKLSGPAEGDKGLDVLVSKGEGGIW